MSKKIYLSPSSQTENAYAVGGTTEAEQCRRIALALAEALKRCGLEAKTNVEPGKSMYDRVAESNAWGADAHIPIHSNAYNGQVAGFRGFYYGTSSEGYPLVKAIMQALAPMMPGDSDAISANPSLYEIQASNAPCAYLEIGFHDNPVEAQFIIDNTRPIAEAICQGICGYYGIPYQEEKDMFEDVAENAWYAEAVKWAVEKGVITGVDETHFAPNEPCTRAQVVAMLYRMSQL